VVSVFLIAFAAGASGVATYGQKGAHGGAVGEWLNEMVLPMVGSGAAVFVYIVLIAICLLFFQTPACYIAAFILTIIAIWFDGLDGFVARLLNESSKFGAVLDILGDRVVENIYWIVFAVLGWIPVWVPLIVVTRGILTDGVRSIALEQGFTAFGSTTMMKTKLGHFLVASNFSRGSYAVTKALAFALMILCNFPFASMNLFLQGSDPALTEQAVSAWTSFHNVCTVICPFAHFCVYAAVAFCVLRGLPVLIESKRFFVEQPKND